MRIYEQEFLKRLKDINAKTVKKDNKYKIYINNKIIATVWIEYDLRVLSRNFHQLDSDIKQEIHTLTYYFKGGDAY